MKQLSQDLRRSPRVVVDVQANVRTSDGRKLPARTRDLSRTGICLVTTDQLKSGDPLNIDLILLFGPTTSSESLPLRARVVWCTSIAKAYQIGVTFEGLSAKESAFLEMFLRYLNGSILPVGAEMETVEETATPVPLRNSSSSSGSADEKDNPFPFLTKPGG
jgi:hypothetical protein